MPSESIVPRVLLIGCGQTALTALESLAERTRVVGLVRDTSPLDDPGADPVFRRAEEVGVPVVGDVSLRGIERLVDRLRPDCVVVSSYNRVLPARVLTLTRFVNVHYSLLPRYRGRANVNWAIINDEASTGITIHVLRPDLDAGNILFQERVAIEPADTVSSLYGKLNGIQRNQLGNAVLRHLNGDDGDPQAAHDATYGCSRLPRDGEIDWEQSTRRIHNLIRALAPPYPGAFTYFEGMPLKIWRAESVSDPPRYEGRIPGRVIRVSKPEGWVDVLTGDGILRVHEVQLEDSPRYPAAELLDSVKHTLGLHSIDLLNRLRSLESAIAELMRQNRQPLLSIE
jgi:methionyl-tRNA formyltransferase